MTNETTPAEVRSNDGLDSGCRGHSAWERFDIDAAAKEQASLWVWECLGDQEKEAFRIKARKVLLAAGAPCVVTEGEDWLRREKRRLERAIRETLEENKHLAEGEDCTLIKLKRALLISHDELANAVLERKP